MSRTMRETLEIILRECAGDTITLTRFVDAGNGPVKALLTGDVEKLIEFKHEFKYARVEAGIPVGKYVTLYFTRKTADSTFNSIELILLTF